MIGMLLQLYRTLKLHRDRGSFWDGITSEIISRAIWNGIYIGITLLVALFWHTSVLPVDARSFGILLVGMGAVKLAHVTARAHIGEFFETTHDTDAVDRDLTTNYYPRVAGNVVDVLSGFFLVAIGFIIRVGADFAGI